MFHTRSRDEFNNMFFHDTIPVVVVAEHRFYPPIFATLDSHITYAKCAKCVENSWNVGILHKHILIMNAWFELNHHP